MPRTPLTILPAAVLALLLVAQAAGSQDSLDASGAGTIESLFPLAAPVTVDGEGLARLILPPEVLTECRGDLSDVRILNAAGQEVPYLIDAQRPPEATLEVGVGFVPQVLALSRETEEREAAPNMLSETYSLSVPATAPPGGAWELVVTARQRDFVRRVEVSQGGEILLAGESLFRLTQPAVTRTRLALPPLSQESLVVRIEGDEGFFLEPAFRFESARTLPGADRARVDLTTLDIEHFDERSEIVIERPLGLVPDRLLLATTTPAFSRRVQVWDDGAGGHAAPAGQATLYRVDPSAGIEQLELDLGALSSDRLRVVIDNGDSPPLDDVRLAAAIRQPALIFSSPGGGRLLFGGGRAHRPRYDLAALQPRLPAASDAAVLGEHLYDPARLEMATLGPISPNARFDPAPALSFAMRPGGPVDERAYTHRQEFTGSPSAEGLVSLDLDLEILAAARGDLADLRIVDRAGHQWAYLLERHAAVVTRRLQAGAARTEDRTSRYEIGLPVQPVALDELILHSAVPYFDRPFRLEAEAADGKSRATLAGGRLARRQGDPRPVHINAGGARIRSLQLEVLNGDDAALDFTRAEGRFTVPRLYFAAPAGEYSILAGNPEDRAPVYELARVRGVVLALAAGHATPEPLGPNPDYSATARLASGSGLQNILLWAAIAIAVAALVWMTLRMARQES